MNLSGPNGHALINGELEKMLIEGGNVGSVVRMREREAARQRVQINCAGVVEVDIEACWFIPCVGGSS